MTNQNNAAQTVLTDDSVIGLSQADGVILPIGANVDQLVPVSAPGANEKTTDLINLRLNSGEHDLQPAVSTFPHHNTPDDSDIQRQEIRAEISRMLKDGLLKVFADGTVGLTAAGAAYARARQMKS